MAEKVKAKDIMTREVISVGPEMPVRALAELFMAKGISGVPVIHMDRLMGIVTEGDLVHKVKRIHLPTVFTILDAVVHLGGDREYQEDLRKMAAATVGEIMSEEVATVGEEAELQEIATLMTENRLHLIPVLREGEVVGVIAKRDVIRGMLQEGDV